ncbi:hypothetical protein ANAEL_02979 [Anaerolineales bacterium]|nr:hypothetical protein ANAEL_02979 [Anaerolineales bacterium]
MMNIRLPKRHIFIIFALTTLLAYGLLVPFTGFYWDDWPFAWSARFLGPADFNPSFAPFRPFLGPIFYLTTTLVPPVPLYWQIFALIIRFVLGISAWWTFRQVWPNRPRLVLIAALFMLVFPGYSQHWVAFTHINQELIPFLFYLLSFGYTFKALRAEKPAAYTIIALLLQLCGIFPTEYFFGIEGLRFLFLFLVLEGNFIRRLTKTFKIWWPYLLIWMLNAAWLIYYYKFGAYASYTIAATQSLTALTFLQDSLDAIWKAGFYVWIQIFNLTFDSPTTPASLLTFGLILLSFAFFAPYLRRAIGETSEESSIALPLILVGIPGILLGRLPSLAAGLPLTLQSSYDRFMISMMIGGSLLLLGVIELLVRNSRVKTCVFAIIIALGIGQQFFNANIFRRDWEDQRNIYWQMAWRMPALQPNTIILTHQMPIDYETDASFTAPINWMYAPDYTRSNLPYLMLYTEKRVGGGTLPSLEPNLPIYFNYRTVSFYGNTSQTVVIYMPRSGCLRVLDPAQGDMETYERLPDTFTQAILLSDPSLIIVNPEKAATPMFFSEPKHEWCYYYTKAELAWQTGDYQKVVSLGSEAVSLGYQPTDQNEWLIFIKAHALTGDLQTAESISTTALKKDARLRRGMCSVWRQIQAQSPVKYKDEIEQTLLTFQCKP